MRRIGLLMLLAVSSAASAQLPPVQLPVQVPALPGVERAVGNTLRELAGVRALRAERLLRANRATLDRDPRGDVIVRAEVVAVDITPAALDKALAAKFRVLRSQDFADLGVRLTVLQTPAGMSATRGLKRLRKLDPQGVYDYNHVYFDSGDEPPGAASPTTAAAAPASTGSALRIGLIDGGIDAQHQSFRGLRLHRFGCGGAAVPSVHGTAVASILVSRRNVGELFVADVYCGEPTGGAVDAVAAAFGWMARERVAVINVSLVGPRNALLERVVRTLLARGHVVVAAVGNDGPAAPPLYPASYEGVVGVTGVDAQHRVLIEAGRGKQVDFAALGANLNAAAKAPDQYSPVRGTSFAAPLVAAMLVELQAPDLPQREQLLQRLSGEARDLGKPGRDDVYGAGELDGQL